MTQRTIDRRTLLGGAGMAAIGLTVLRWPSAQASPPGGRFQVSRTPAEWRRLLGPQRYHILREGGTERAFTSPLNKEHRKGVFVCAGCAQPLFSSATKFDSGTGWPSFWRPLPRAVATKADRSYGMVRTEVLCSRCGGHLGHVFDDGPKPTGLRYCMNGLSLKFRPA
jgi:peptide-methionine (R)-S-oxide reductase